MMLRFYNTKSSMLYNLLRLDEARCFILDELLDKTQFKYRVQRDAGVRFYSKYRKGRGIRLTGA